jgi:hypothetical protein
MSFSDDQLLDDIARKFALNESIVVLCEGGKPMESTATALNIDEYAQQTQDSAFYYQAIPDWWRRAGKVDPNFYPCGSQQNVIKTYFRLREKFTGTKPPIPTNKLFALIDIDLRHKKIPGEYPFSDLESIYQNLYQNGKVTDNSQNHAIWVTGLLHKEAYFLIPELQDLFKHHRPTPLYDNNLVDLASLYQKMALGINTQDDLRNASTVSRALARIQHHGLSNSGSIEDFQKNWQDYFSHHQTTDEEKKALAYVLLTLAQSKPEWDRIKFSSSSVESTPAKVNKNYRDQLCLKIAKDFYAKQSRNSDHHLPQFFHRLAQTP